MHDSRAITTRKEGQTKALMMERGVSEKKREEGQRSAASMLTPFTYLRGSNRVRTIMEGTRIAKRDSEGSKHQADNVPLCFFGETQGCRVSPICSMMLVPCGPRVILSREGERHAD